MGYCYKSTIWQNIPLHHPTFPTPSQKILFPTLTLTSAKFPATVNKSPPPATPRVIIVYFTKVSHTQPFSRWMISWCQIFKYSNYITNMPNIQRIENRFQLTLQVLPHSCNRFFTAVTKTRCCHSQFQKTRWHSSESYNSNSLCIVRKNMHVSGISFNRIDFSFHEKRRDHQRSFVKPQIVSSEINFPLI